MEDGATSTAATAEGLKTVTRADTATASSRKTARKRKRISIGESNDDLTTPGKTRDYGIAKDREAEAKPKAAEPDKSTVLASFVSAPVNKQAVSRAVSGADTAEIVFGTFHRSSKKTRNSNNQQEDGTDNSTSHDVAPVATSPSNQAPKYIFAAPSIIFHSSFFGMDESNSLSSTPGGSGLITTFPGPMLPPSGSTLLASGITVTSDGLTMSSSATSLTVEEEALDDELERALEEAFIKSAAEETLAEMNEAGFGDANTVSRHYPETALNSSSIRTIVFNSSSSQVITTPSALKEVAGNECPVSSSPSPEFVDYASDPREPSAEWSQSTMNAQDEVFGQDMQLQSLTLDKEINASTTSGILEATRNPLNFMSYGNPPPPGANAMLRLECFAIDFALSPSNFRLDHYDGPYFTQSLGEEERICFVKEFSTATHRIHQVRQAYSMPLVVDKIMIKFITWSEELEDDPGYTYYNIRCSAEAFYDDGNTVLLDIDDDNFRKWRMSTGPSWRLKGRREDDTAFDSIEWRGIVNLLAAFAVNVFNHGVRRLERDVLAWMISTDPLSPIGVNGELWDRIRKEGHFGMSLENLRTLKGTQTVDGNALTVGSLYGLENVNAEEVAVERIGDQKATKPDVFEVESGNLLP